VPNIKKIQGLNLGPPRPVAGDLYLYFGDYLKFTTEENCIREGYVIMTTWNLSDCN